MTIKDITGKVIEVTGIYAAIRQCEMYKNSPFKTSSGHTRKTTPLYGSS
jgi:hypothetical protein